jgi:hypothetical protein
LFPAPVAYVITDGVAATLSPAAEDVMYAPAGAPVPVPTIPLLDAPLALPVWYGVPTGVGMTVRVDDTILTVTYEVTVEESVVVGPAPVDSTYSALPEGDDVGNEFRVYVASPAGTEVGYDSGADVASAATGQYVVYRLMISVVTDPIFAGQSVTDAAQDVMV